MTNRIFLSVFVFLFFNIAALFAQEEETVIGNIDEVVITATRASVNRSNVPMTITLVDREEIEQSSESSLLKALTEHVPGMFVTQRGVTGFGVSSGGTGGITMRGMGGSPTTELLVLIDGHPQYMGIMGHHLPDAYVASDVEKVEVIRGPASILYGSNAMGGVINIITRKQDEEGWSASGRIMYGSYNTQKYMASGGLKKGKFNGFVSVNHDHTDGHRRNTDDRDRHNSAFSITNGYAKLGYQINDHFQAWGDVSLASFEAQNPGIVARPMFDNIANILRGVSSFTVENHYDKSSGAFKFFYNFGNHKINDGYAAVSSGGTGTPRNYFFRSNDHNYGVTLYQSFRPFAGNLITAGLDYKNFGGQAWNDFIDGSPKMYSLEKKSLNETAGYVIAQQTLFGKLTLNVGLRLENNENFGTEWAPQAGLSYRPLQHTVLKAMVSKGYRSPTMREMYMYVGVQNPDLKPERMMNYELSVRQGFFGGRWTAELTGYIADGNNLIVAQMVEVAPGDTRSKNLNVGDFNNKGIELELKWNVMENFDVKGSYSYLKMKKIIVSAPEQQAYFAANYRLKQWSLNANYQYINGLYIIAGDNSVSVNYGLLNAKVSYRPMKWLDVFVKGENLANKKYEIVNGYPMPGVTVFGGINLKFGN